MKTSYSCGICGLLALALGLLVSSPAPSSGQAGAAVAMPDPDLGASTQLVAEIAKQQAEITANQAEIDKKIAAIGEEIRQARLFSARAGGSR